MARIAVPNWNGRVSPVFDVASELLVQDVHSGSRCRETLQGPLMFQKVEHLKDLKIDVVICGGISNPFREAIEGAGMEVIPWRSGPVERVLQAYAAGSVQDRRFAMPGRNGGKRSRHRGGRRRGGK